MDPKEVSFEVGAGEAVREELQRVFDEYEAARKERFAGHPLAWFLRETLGDVFRDAVAAGYPEFVWKGSSGIGNWVEGPWLAAFDPAITTSAQRGYYPVFLFSSAFDSVYWSMNQGVTALRDEFRSAVAREMLGHRATRLRARVEAELPIHFRTDAIDLNAPRPSHLLGLYEAGHAFGPRYARGDLPTEDQLRADVETMLRLYRLVAARGGTDDVDVDVEGNNSNEESGGGGDTLSEARRYRYHRRLERNAALVRAAKSFHGDTCQCCKFNFEKVYGELGRDYIEAHHLVPLASMDGEGPVARSPEHDFRVLCSNCHRMIHRMIREVGGEVTVEALQARLVG